MLSNLLIRGHLLLGGLACAVCGVWATYDFVWDKHHHTKYLVVGGIFLISLAALLPVAAEYAHRCGMWALKWGAWCAVPLTLAFVFTASIQRTGISTDNDEAQHKQIAEEIKIPNAKQVEALAQLVFDKAEVAKSCDMWGANCNKAKAAQNRTEDKLKTAHAVLKTHGVEVDDSMASWLVTYLPFLTKEQVFLDQPLLLPMGLAIIGSLLIAIGSRGGKRSARPGNRVIKITAPVPPKDFDRVVIAASSEAEIDPSPVVLFLKRKLPATSSVEADLADVYVGFLKDWSAQGHANEPLTAAQFGLVMNYICRQARIRVERRGKRIVCVDRQLIE